MYSSSGAAGAAGAGAALAFTGAPIGLLVGFSLVLIFVGLVLLRASIMNRRHNGA